MSPFLDTDIFLTPGGFHFGGGQVRVTTLLGSCVAITMWNPTRRVGGMCHYVLAQRPGGSAHLDRDARYGDEAVALFLGELERAGAVPSEFVVKLFGGAHMFKAARTRAAAVPDRNVEHGRELLARHGFAIAAEHVGGTRARRVVFDLSSGDVWIKSVFASPAQALFA